MKNKLAGFVFCLLLIITGCSPVRLPNVSNYQFTSEPAFSVPNHARTHKVLYVMMPVANPGYDSSEMLYMEVPYKLSAFSLHQWVAPPAKMLQPVIVQAIRARGYFKAVVAIPSAVGIHYRLELQLLELQQEFLTPDSKVRMAVQATLINNTTNQVMGSKRFDALIPAEANNPYAGVLATNQAVTRVAKRVARFACEKAAAMGN